MTIFRNFKNQSTLYNHIWYHLSCQHKRVRDILERSALQEKIKKHACC